MYISKAKKYRDQGDGTAIGYDYYRLTKSYTDKDGKTKHRSVLCLGELPGFSKEVRDELASMLTTMIEEGQSVLCDNVRLYEEAMRQYVKYRSSRYAQENDPRLIAERQAPVGGTQGPGGLASRQGVQHVHQDCRGDLPCIED